jgi:cytochrome P450
MGQPVPVDVPPLFGPAFDADPYPALAWLREHSPVHRLELPGGIWTWFITRHADAVDALTDPRLAKSPDLADERWRRAGMGLPFDHRESLVHHMLNTDAPDHARLRRAISDELLDRIAPLGRADLIADLAYPLPITIIGDLLGVPRDRLAEFHRHASVIDSSSYHDLDEVGAATDGLEEFVAALVEFKRANPGEDLLSALVGAAELGRDELTATAFLLLVAGHETTVAFIGNAMLILLRRPDQVKMARDDPDALARVMEEALRFDGPVRNATWRFPTEPVAVAGQCMQPGEPILISLLSANRDPSVFADADEFDPGRDNRGHLAFGRGPHFCVGAALARLEGTIAVGTLLRRFPNLALAEPAEQLAWWPSPIMRGLFRLPVKF